MTYLRNSAAGIDYRPCTYGSSKLVFRGPKAALDRPYLAFLGSTATFGKFVATPFPELAGQGLGIGAVNLGCVNAGVDTFAGEEAVTGICRKARACVLQVMGAHRLSNPLYGVHPRRNDRVLTPTPRLRELYPEVDFAEIHFTRHLIATLARDPGRFAGVRDVLRSRWVSRMSRLIARLGVPVVLLWLTDGSEGEADDAGPLLVDRDMIEALTHAPAAVVRVETGRLPEPDGEMLALSPFDEAAARELPGSSDDRRIAEALSAELRPFVG